MAKVATRRSGFPRQVDPPTLPSLPGARLEKIEPSPIGSLRATKGWRGGGVAVVFDPRPIDSIFAGLRNLLEGNEVLEVYSCRTKVSKKVVKVCKDGGILSIAI